MSSLNINRWLNWRKVSKHKKQTSYLQIPVFSFTNPRVWQDASIIIAQYNFTTSQNFTIDKNMVVAPEDSNFVLCVKYRVGNTVYRYKFWNLDSDTINFPLYNGEIVKKNCTFEVWSTSGSTTVDNPSIITILISVLRDKTLITDSDSYENNVGVVTSDLENTNGNAGVFTANNYQESSDKIISSTNAAPTAFVTPTGAINGPAGWYRVLWRSGVYNDGKWRIGTYSIYGHATLEVYASLSIPDPLDDDEFNTEALATTAAYNLDVAFYAPNGIAAPTMKLVANDPGNVDGTPAPTFSIAAGLGFPLTFAITTASVTN